MKHLLLNFEREIRQIKSASTSHKFSNENVRRSSDFPELTPFPPSPAKPFSLKSSSLPASLDISLTDIDSSLPLQEKTRIFRQAVERTVQNSAKLITNRIEMEFRRELEVNLKEKLGEIERNLKEDLENAIVKSKTTLRFRLKQYISEVVEEKKDDLGSDHDINLRDSQPMPYFQSVEPVLLSSQNSTQVPIRPSKVSAYLQRFLESRN